jgi:DNA-3-methyladenine glycosylase II
MATLMQDHPAWLPTSTGSARVVQSASSTWLASWDNTLSEQVDATLLDGIADAAPRVVRIVAPRARRSAIEHAVAGVGPLLRLANPDLWDAIGTAIIRQVIRADQARAMYRRFCEEHGNVVETPIGNRHLFPAPDALLDLPVTAFAAIGMAFKHPALAAAAAAYLSHADAWPQLEPPALVVALQAVPRIGPWTAGAAVADWSGDFSIYPYADLAVRTWARRADPTTDWPTDEAAFAELWRRISKDNLSLPPYSTTVSSLPTPLALSSFSKPARSMTSRTLGLLQFGGPVQAHRAREVTGVVGRDVLVDLDENDRRVIQVGLGPDGVDQDVSTTHQHILSLLQGRRHELAVRRTRTTETGGSTHQGDRGHGREP